MTTLNKTKFAIIGRVWINNSNGDILPSSITLSQDMTFRANETYQLLGGKMTFKTDRNLNASPVVGEVLPVVLPAGSTLNFYGNPKRADHKDADLTASSQFSEEVADTIINNSKRSAEAWKLANA